MSGIKIYTDSIQKPNAFVQTLPWKGLRALRTKT